MKTSILVIALTTVIVVASNGLSYGWGGQVSRPNQFGVLVLGSALPDVARLRAENNLKVQNKNLGRIQTVSFHDPNENHPNSDSTKGFEVWIEADQGTCFLTFGSQKDSALQLFQILLSNPNLIVTCLNFTTSDQYGDLRIFADTFTLEATGKKK